MPKNGRVTIRSSLVRGEAKAFLLAARTIFDLWDGLSRDDHWVEMTPAFIVICDKLKNISDDYYSLADTMEGLNA